MPSSHKGRRSRGAPGPVPGRIEIAPRAVATLASRAVLDCYGVVGLASPPLGQGLVRLLPGASAADGVRVRVRQGRITVELYLVLEYGLRVSQVARNVMETVRFRLEEALGVPVAEVNVHVQGLRLEEGRGQGH